MQVTPRAHVEFKSNLLIFNNSNRTSCVPIQPVIRRVINKSERSPSSAFVNHSYDYRLNWKVRCPVTN